MNDNFCVYIHTSPSGKRYIGITGQKPERRWRKNGLGYKDHTYFWNAICRYSWDNFKHEIVASNLTKEEAEQMKAADLKTPQETGLQIAEEFTWDAAL